MLKHDIRRVLMLYIPGYLHLHDMMQIRGVNYDTGIETFAGLSSRPFWNPKVVEREIEIISHYLHCNAIRVYGDNIQRLVFAAECALKNKLEVWISPNRPNCDITSTLDFIKESASAAENLSKQDSNIVLVIASESSLFVKGIMPGETDAERLALLADPVRFVQSTSARHDSPKERFDDFIRKALAVSKKEFGGPLSYASGAWEDVDWSHFDYVGLDAYRDANTRQSFAVFLRHAKQFGKPVVATEFGCCTFRGARDKGAWAWTIADRKQDRINVSVRRDEDEQANELNDVLKIFNSEELAGAFAFTFVASAYPHRSSNPERDLDMASYAIVKTLEGDPANGYLGLPWKPKQAFYELARQYSQMLT